MATFPSSKPPNASSSAPTPTNTASGSGSGLFNNTGNLTSLYLYTFIATLSLLFTIFALLVGRTVRIRRRRNAALLAAIAAGTYVPPPPRNGKRRDDHLLPKPTLWEVHIAAAPAHDPEKGWSEILPVAGATLVPVTHLPPRPLRRASWSPRQLIRFGRSTDTLDLPPATIATTSLEASDSPTPPPPEPVRLAVLISMPTRTGRGRAEHGGSPVVEFGVAHVAYAHPGVDPAMSV
ncbi:hypothetical protein EI94DRAFT_1799559 [Lactarius quietus]|nr:hypothetical protein EI94DRAFT_1799559 [Lactarius quietus]